MMTLILIVLASTAMIVSHLANPAANIASEDAYDYR